MNLGVENMIYKTITGICLMLLFIEATLKNFGLISKNVSVILICFLTILYVSSLIVVKFDLIKKVKSRSKKNQNRH